MSKGRTESLVFDTGVLVEIVNGSELGLGLKPKLEDGTVVPHVTDVNLFELSYLVCRKEGWEKATQVVGSLRRAGYFEVHDAHGFMEGAAKLKCERALSMADCLAISAGRSLGVPVLFARHEKELDAEAEKRAFDVELRFLTDIAC